MKLFPSNMVVMLLTFLLTATGNCQTAGDPILRRICRGSCTGRLASITAWYNSEGKVDYYELSGDVSTCSHPPLILYDSKGREALTIPNQPIDPRKKEIVKNLEKLRQKRKQLLSAHSPSKSIFCSEIMR
jgi:hypothetical protein